MVAGVDHVPNAHDILTGSQADGRAFPPGEDRTCSNWTSSTQGAAMVGHSDRKGLRETPRPGRGIRRIPRAGLMAAAAKRSERHRRQWLFLLLRR